MKAALAVTAFGAWTLFSVVAQTTRAGFDPAALDRSVAPQDDLYAYMNGAWLRDTVMPPDCVSYGAFGEIERFFVGWARSWRAKERDDYVHSQLQVSAHLPARFRANAALVNVDAFYDAFGVTPPHRLYVAPADRVRIW